MNATLSRNTEKYQTYACSLYKEYLYNQLRDKQLQKSCCLWWTSRFRWTIFKAFVLVHFVDTIFDVIDEQVSQDNTNDLEI